MDNSSFSYREEDITNVFSSIVSTPSEDIADGLFLIDRANTAEGSFFEERRNAAVSRINSLKGLIASIQPDLESSGLETVEPWSGASLERVSGKGWSSILGMKVAIPGYASRKQKGWMISNLLMSMSRI